MNKRLRTGILTVLSLICLTTIALPSTALAAKAEFCDTKGAGIVGFLSFPTWYKYLNPTFVEDKKAKTSECKLTVDIKTDLPKVLLAVFEIILRVGGLVAVVFTIFGGVKYILSQGEPDKIKGARTTIINSLVGLVIAMSAVAIVNLIGRNL